MPTNASIRLLRPSWKCAVYGWLLLFSWNLLIVVAIGARANGKDGPHTPTYAAIIGTVSEKVDSVQDPLITIGKGNFGGPLVLWVNDDPVALYAGELHVINLNRWLLNGANQLTFSGNHALPVYVSLVKRREGEASKNIGKRKFPVPGGDLKDSALVFRVDKAPPLPPRELLGTSAQDRQRYQKEIEAILADLTDLLRRHKGREAADALLAGKHLWGDALGIKRSSRQQKIVAFLSDAQTKIKDADRAVKMVFGDRAVLVYGTPTTKSGKGFHLLSAERGKETMDLWPVQFARVKGKWIVWNSE